MESYILSYKFKTFQNKLVKLRIIDYKIIKSTTTKLNLINGSNEFKFTPFERKFLFLASPTQLSAAAVSSKCKQSMIQTIEYIHKNVSPMYVQDDLLNSSQLSCFQLTHVVHSNQPNLCIKFLAL